MTLPASTVTRLEKAAADNGFDINLSKQGDWLAFASTQAPLKIWLTAISESALSVAMSQHNVAKALSDYGEPSTGSFPVGTVASRVVSNIPTLHRLLRRAFQLSRTLPDELLHTFQQKTANLPRTTEAERLVVQRVGQDVFRHGLIDYWDGRCAITGLAVTELLRASHVKPWADCASDAERLDVFNGLLLAPQLDAAFDRGFIAVADDGLVVLSPALGPEAAHLLGLDKPLRVSALADGHRTYLPWHRGRVFRAHVDHG